MPQKVRVGVVGTSEWADWIYLSSLATHPRAQLAALCGRDQARAGEVAAKHGIPQVFADYNEMIARGGLDALIVASPDDLHHQITMAALDAGLHVLCEKPLALTAAQAKQMYTRAEVAGVVHMAMFTYHWFPAYQYLHELVGQGYIGQPYDADLTFVMGHARNLAYQWRFDGQRANGALGDLGSHAFYIVRWLLGDIVAVTARLATFVPRPGPDGAPGTPTNDSALLLLECASGAQVSVRVSAADHTLGHWARHQIALYGQAGTLEADAFQAALRGARAPGTEAELLPVPERLLGAGDRTDPFDPIFSRSAGARAFVDAIVEGRAVGPTFFDGLKAQEAIDAALESHRSGRRVVLASNNA
jgi:predicted dehydrogenase